MTDKTDALLALADSWVPDGSDERETEFDRGYEQALSECASQLRSALASAPSADNRPFGALTDLYNSDSAGGAKGGES